MSENIQNRREFILNYFESLKYYRELEYRISGKHIEKERERLQFNIKETQKKLRAVRKDLKKARNHWFYGPLVTLSLSLNDRLENLLPVYRTAVGKSIIWLFLIVSVIEIPVVTAIYFSAITTLYFADVSSSNKKQGRKYLVSEENRLFKRLEKLNTESLEFESTTDSAKAQFALQANKLYSKIQELEAYVQKIFKEDAKEITNSGLNVLNIENPQDTEQDSVKKEKLERKPILMFDGIKSKHDERSSIVKISGRQKEEDKLKLLLPEKSFYYCETKHEGKKTLKGLDNRYKYSVYEFVVIYLSSNFLSYYRCYWDFIRGSLVDEEIAEYLYDSIVSIKTRERSSLNTQKDDERRTYRHSLMLTTMDGSTNSFILFGDKKIVINPGKINSENISELYDAAESIRYWLRQRRLEYVNTRSVDPPDI